MRTINAADLKDMLDRGEDVILINVLPPDAFEAEHIPGSHNIPSSRLDLPTKVAALAGSKDRVIVVYCSSKLCQASPQAARKLVNSGFTNVVDFEGGMDEWKRAGYYVESGAAAPTR